ncbi:MAG: TrkA family potassium uptake protein [Fimbriimonadaceae bacterium]|nr:TrkA family potassium uptake protein [Fimbriimonadaceae bacterium]
MYLILVGGGNVGMQLAKKLIGRGHEVLLMEKDGKQATRLATVLGEESVFVGDGCEVATQKEAGFNRADAVVAVTGEDEDNLVVCQMAKVVWNVQRVLARVNDPSHEEIFKKIGVDQTVSATSLIFSLLDQQITMDEFIQVGALAKGNIEIVELILSGRSPVLGMAVRDLTLPPKTNIIYILRKEQGLLVSGDTTFEEGDTILALVPSDQADALRGMLH